MMPALIDMTGQRIGRLTVLGRAPGTPQKDARWSVRCDCGSETSVIGYSLRKDKTTLSCGCLNREINSQRAKHGGSHSPEYRNWYAMKQRCNNPRNIGYKMYGALGVRVCERWLNDFAAFYADMGQRPSPLHTIDRRDSAGNYEPGNCQWATKAEQSANRKTSHFVVYRGTRVVISEAVRLAGSIVAVSTANGRVRRGWDVARAVETPPTQASKRRRKVTTSYVFPPIPDRRWDWVAYYDDLGADDSPYGYGRTEAEAKQNLIGNYEDE